MNGQGETRQDRSGSPRKTERRRGRRGHASGFGYRQSARSCCSRIRAPSTIGRSFLWRLLPVHALVVERVEVAAEIRPMLELEVAQWELLLAGSQFAGISDRGERGRREGSGDNRRRRQLRGHPAGTAFPENGSRRRWRERFGGGAVRGLSIRLQGRLEQWKTGGKGIAHPRRLARPRGRASGRREYRVGSRRPRDRGRFEGDSTTRAPWVIAPDGGKVVARTVTSTSFEARRMLDATARGWLEADWPIGATRWFSRRLAGRRIGMNLAVYGLGPTSRRKWIRGAISELVRGR